MIERRAAPRIPIRVQMEARKNGDVFPGTSVNLSETGIMIETSKQLQVGERITIRLILPTQDEIVGYGHVVRREEWGLDKFGIAVHWELDNEQRNMVARLIQNASR
jgi:PilZ domain